MYQVIDEDQDDLILIGCFVDCGQRREEDFIHEKIT